METLFEHQSPFQLITLEGSGGRLKLYLDGYYQFDSETEKCYHGMIATLPLAMSANADRVLIMGGGDALALRDSLKFPVTEAFLVELDPDMIKVASKGPLMILNESSLSDPRARVMIGDAAKEISRFPDHYFDVIIADFPAATSPELQRLYSPVFYDMILSKLAPGGVFVSQVSENVEFTRELRRYLEATLGHAFTLITTPKRTECQPFVYGSTEPFALRRAIPADSAIGHQIPGILEAVGRGKKVISYEAERTVRGA